MVDWQSSIDEQLRKAQESDEWKNLPGQGKPLNLNDDPNTPDEMRMAYKILRENDLAPAWIMEGKELDVEREKLVNQLQAAVRSGGAANVKTSLKEAVTLFNKRILSYNLKLPPGVIHKRSINLQRELDQR